MTLSVEANLQRWMQRAEADWQTCQREACVEHKTNWDAVIFHAQQSAEKYLKAVLKQCNQPIEKTHSLGKLLLDIRIHLPQFGLQLDEPCVTLSSMMLPARYPMAEEEELDHEDAQQAIEYGEAIRLACRKQLKLEGEC